MYLLFTLLHCGAIYVLRKRLADLVEPVPICSSIGHMLRELRHRKNQYTYMYMVWNLHVRTST